MQSSKCRLDDRRETAIVYDELAAKFVLADSVTVVAKVFHKLAITSR